MKKALFMVALYLVPFFSLGAEVSNIFEDGTVSTEPPKFTSGWTVDCNIFSGVHGLSGEGAYSSALAKEMCVDILKPISSADFDSTKQCPYGYPNDNGVTPDIRASSVKYIRACSNDNGGKQNVIGSYSITLSNLVVIDEIITCPPDGSPTHTYGHIGVSGDIESCASPQQISQVDDCNATSGNEYLTIDVSSPQGCFPQPNGSICKYDAVDVGGGNEYYALDLEGDCYSENDYPDLEGTPEIAPVGEDCADYGGGVVGCPEDPENVCTSGSSYAGGSVQDCQTGCGMVNDQFICIDQDSDNDGVPDYKDEDSNDNTDCPVGETCDDSGDDSGTGECPEGQTCTGGGGGAFDDSGIIAELKKLNKDLIKEQTFADGTEVKELFDDKKTELETKTDEFFNSTELSDIENFADKNNIQADFFQINDALSGSSCSNPSHSNLSSFDICQKIIAVRPYLYILFGVLTFIALIYRFAFYIKGN